MLSYFLQVFLLGLAYVAPIGMQNMYVINTAIRSNKLRAYQVAFITIFFDISLALACSSFTWFTGLTTVISTFRTVMNDKMLRYINIICGSIIIFYGVKLGFTLIAIIMK